MPLTKVQGGSIETPVDISAVNLTGITTAANLNVTGVSTLSSAIVGSAVTITSGGIVAGLSTVNYINATHINISGVTTVSAGSASAPSISPTGDSNTGIFFPSADTIAFGEGGAEALRIDSSGNLGIGTDTQTGKLDVAVTSTGKSNIVFTNSGESPILSFKSNGVQNCGKIVVSESLGGGYLSINTKTGSGADTPRLNIDTSGNIGIATDNIRHRFQVGLVKDRLVGIGYSTNTAGNNVNTIKSHNEANNPENLQLVADTFTITTGTSVNGTERLRILGTNGNIGIGSTGDNTPTSKLTLYNADSTGMRFYRSQGDRFGEILYDTGSYFAIRQPTNDPVEIQQNTGNAIFRVDSSGNVGINTRQTRGKMFISVSRADLHTSGDAAQALNIKQNSLGAYEGIYIERSGERKGCWIAIADSGTANDALFFTHNQNGVTSTSLCLNRSGIAFFPATTTTASAANAFLDSASTPVNRLYRSTSSLRYKKNIENIWEDRGEIVFDLRPVWYRSKCETDRQEWSWYGFIAEEVAEIDPRLVHWTYLEDAYEEIVKETEYVTRTRPVLDSDGSPLIKDNGEQIVEEYIELVERKDKVLKADAQMVPDGVQYDRLTVLLTKTIQQMKNKYDQEISTLKTEIETLKNIINN